MKKLPIAIVLMASFLCGCTYLLDYKKDVAITEDIIDDIVKEETGTELNIGPEHQPVDEAATVQTK